MNKDLLIITCYDEYAANPRLLRLAKAIDTYAENDVMICKIGTEQESFFWNNIITQKGIKKENVMLIYNDILALNDAADDKIWSRLGNEMTDTYPLTDDLYLAMKKRGYEGPVIG